MGEYEWVPPPAFRFIGALLHAAGRSLTLQEVRPTMVTVRRVSDRATPQTEIPQTSVSFAMREGWIRTENNGLLPGPHLVEPTRLGRP